MGNWEQMGRLGERENVQIAAVAKSMHNPLVNESIVRQRAVRGLEVLLVKSSMKQVVDALRRGKWVAFLGAQVERRHGTFVDFFGRPASTAEGPAYFSKRLGLPILPVFCVRLRDKERSLRLVFCPPIQPDDSLSREDDIKRMTLEHVRSLESVVRRYPEDYFWLHRRWKTQPKRRRKQAEQAETLLS
jgi:KDO2-lipid IV(A) lauroyltransferase